MMPIDTARIRIKWQRLLTWSVGAYLRLSTQLTRFIDEANPYDPRRLVVSDRKPVSIDESRIKERVLKVSLAFFGGFLLWSLIAPLDAGVQIPGQITVSGKRKAIAHPQGGVVLALHVAEGDKVNKGQVLLEINPLDTEANLTEAQLDYVKAMAVESRLLAERSDAEAIVWLDALRNLLQSDSRVQQAMRAQEEVFNSGRSERLQSRLIMSRKITNLNDQLKELEYVLKLKKEQLNTLSKEVKNSRSLAKEGYVPQSVANDAERERNALLSSISASVNQVSATQSEIASGELAMIQKDAEFKKQVNEQLAEIQKERKILASRVQSLVFDRELTQLRAPVAGTVVGLRANTEGGVIQAAETLLEIVPLESKLIVEARVSPFHIDKVRKGLPADLRFSAFDTRTTPIIEGQVSLVGADVQPASERGGSGYYLAIIETRAGSLEALDGLELQPGMPVDVIVKTGERTFMSYLLKPLSDSLASSFKD